MIRAASIAYGPRWLSIAWYPLWLASLGIVLHSGRSSLTYFPVGGLEIASAAFIAVMLRTCMRNEMVDVIPHARRAHVALVSLVCVATVIGSLSVLLFAGWNWRMATVVSIVPVTCTFVLEFFGFVVMVIMAVGLVLGSEHLQVLAPEAGSSISIAIIVLCIGLIAVKALWCSTRASRRLVSCLSFVLPPRVPGVANGHARARPLRIARGVIMTSFRWCWITTKGIHILAAVVFGLMAAIVHFPMLLIMCAGGPLQVSWDDSKRWLVGGWAAVESLRPLSQRQVATAMTLCLVWSSSLSALVAAILYEAVVAAVPDMPSSRSLHLPLISSLSGRCRCC